jgi:chitin disaccharide deacetylase
MTIVADDYGIGPETSRGILDLARDGILTATVMIVNCDDAERAVDAWRKAAPDADLGWHPNLTLDRPIAPPESVPTLVRPDGTFWPLGDFLKRVLLRKLSYDDILREWRAQYRRFVDMVGSPPPVVNSHQHVSLFPPAENALFDLLAEEGHRPYLRRVVEPFRPLIRIPGARIKRSVLSVLGHRVARRAAARGLPGCGQLIGVTDPDCVTDADFWTRWIRLADRKFDVEICCHPGYSDATLEGRDCDSTESLLRRPRETQLLLSPTFREIRSEFQWLAVRPSQLEANRQGLRRT